MFEGNSGEAEKDVSGFKEVMAEAITYGGREIEYDV
jgi:hypothetical protein